MSDKIALLGAPATRILRGLRAAAALAADYPPAWRAFRWLAEGDYRRAGAVVGRFCADGERWLDLGCGEAPLAAWIPAPCYTGVDINPARLARARLDNPAHEFVCHDLTLGPGPLEPHPRFLVAHLLHHLDETQVARLAGAMARLASPGARALVIDPVPPRQARKPLHRALLPLETGRHHRPLEQTAHLLGITPEHRGHDAGSFWYDAYWFEGALDMGRSSVT